MCLFSWKSHFKTLTFLILYTLGVWYPQLFLIYPIIAIIFTAVLKMDRVQIEKKREKWSTILINLQNLTIDFIYFFTLIAWKVEELCTFKDQKKTTRLFYALPAVIVFLLVIGPYIPWKFIFVVGMWLALLMRHPKITKRSQRNNQVKR
ncbi:unnamed protein product [Ambrosiozyma monospora]|uniref:Unnamed protein product n=1 Tax=Ambrosiozyma monospora TaxID=43982 RepID=A0A9W7DGE7_AMBMO|nr:unnamed protein product [Ambrosiozyma monospora]